jgi:hypothetical protein
MHDRGRSSSNGNDQFPMGNSPPFIGDWKLVIAVGERLPSKVGRTPGHDWPMLLGEGIPALSVAPAGLRTISY